MWLEYKGPVAEEAGATTVMEGMIDSLGPSVAVAYYDVLAIQLRVNLMQVANTAGCLELWPCAVVVVFGVVVGWSAACVACWLGGEWWTVAH